MYSSCVCQQELCATTAFNVYLTINSLFCPTDKQGQGSNPALSDVINPVRHVTVSVRQYQHCKPLLAFLHTCRYLHKHVLLGIKLKIRRGSCIISDTYHGVNVSGNIRQNVIFFTPQRRKIRLKMQHESPSHPPSTECSLLADTCYLWGGKNNTELNIGKHFVFVFCAFLPFLQSASRKLKKTTWMIYPCCARNFPELGIGF